MDRLRFQPLEENRYPQLVILGQTEVRHSEKLPNRERAAKGAMMLRGKALCSGERTGGKHIPAHSAQHIGNFQEIEEFHPPGWQHTYEASLPLRYAACQSFFPAGTDSQTSCTCHFARPARGRPGQQQLQEHSIEAPPYILGALAMVVHAGTVAGKKERLLSPGRNQPLTCDARHRSRR